MKTAIIDTCDVVFKRLSDGKVMLTAEAQLASVTQSINEERIKGGIGNRDIFVLRSDKEVDLQVRSALFDSDWLEMVNGTVYSEETNTIHQKEEGLVVADGEVEIKGEPKDGAMVYIFDARGNKETIEASEATLNAIPVTLEDTEDGDIVTVLYELEVSGQTLSIDATKFPSRVMVEYHTVEYDIETDEIVNDLYWVFNNVSPSGDYDYSFENGTAIAPEIDFTALSGSGSSEIGKVIQVPRVN